MLELVVAIGFWVVIAAHHFIIDELQFLLGSLAHDYFFVVFLGDDSGWEIASDVADGFADRSAGLLFIL
jgi:hypothetical protein